MTLTMSNAFLCRADSLRCRPRRVIESIKPVVFAPAPALPSAAEKADAECRETCRQLDAEMAEFGEWLR